MTSAETTRTTYRPLPAPLREDLLGTPRLFLEELDNGRWYELQTRALEARASVLIGRALLDGVRGDLLAEGSFVDRSEACARFVGRLRSFHRDWQHRAKSRRRKSPNLEAPSRQPSLEELRATFGEDAELAAAIWPAVHFVIAADATELIETELAVWAEGDLLLLSVENGLVTAPIAKAAARTHGRAKRAVLESSSGSEGLDEAYSRVTADMAAKRESILANYEPRGDERQLAGYLTKISKRMLDDHVDTHGPRASTRRNYKRKQPVGAESLSHADHQKLFDAGIAAQRHRDPDHNWEPVSIVARELAARFGCGERLVYKVFHEERSAGRLIAERPGTAWRVTSSARKHLVDALRERTI